MPFFHRKALSEKGGKAGKFGWKYQEHILIDIQTLYHLFKCQSWNPACTGKEMGIPDNLTWLLRNMYAGQVERVRTEHGKTDWFQIGNEVCQGCILSSCLFNFYAEYIMRNAGLEHKLESRFLGEISVTSDMQMTPPLWQKVKRN